MTSNFKQYLRYTSWPIIAAMLTLIVVGLSAIRISDQAEGPSTALLSNADKQLAFAAVGLLFFIIATLVPYSRVGHLAYVLFAITLVLLVVVFVPTPLTIPRKGSHRWIGLQELSLQPSEVAKISFIVLLAWYLRFRDNYRRLRGLLVPFVLTIVPMVLILREPDLGTSLLFLPTLYFMLFMAGAKLRHLLVILALGTVLVLLPVPRSTGGSFDPQRDVPAGRFVKSTMGPVNFYRVNTDLDWSRQPITPVAYCRFQIGSGGTYDLQPLSIMLMKGHQIERVEGWLRQEDPRIKRTIGYQIHQSKIILGSGCLTGRSGWNDVDSFYSILPEDHTDFILSVIGGQWGFLGCLAVLFLYGVIFVMGVEIAVITSDPFGRLLAVGVLALLFTQLFINAGMAMGMMPVTGMTLPFVSYGGSSLVVNCAALGLLVNVGQRRPLSLAPKPFEYSGEA